MRAALSRLLEEGSRPEPKPRQNAMNTGKTMERMKNWRAATNSRLAFPSEGSLGGWHGGTQGTRQMRRALQTEISVPVVCNASRCLMF